MFLILLLVLLAFVATVVLLALPHVFSGRGLRLLRRGVVAFDVLTAVGLVLGPIVFHEVMGVSAVLLRIASVGFVMQIFFALLTGLGLLFQWMTGFLGKGVPFDRSRRRMLRHAAVVPALAAIGGLYGGLYEKDATVEREILVPIRDLPTPLKGLRIAQLSDVHLGWYFSLDDLAALLERTAKGAPDVLVITGDLFDDEAINLAAVALVDRYCERFPLGIWFIYGNHEHRRNFAAIDAALDGTQIHKLVNGAALLMDAPRPLWLVGIDYPQAHGDEAFQAKKKEYTDTAYQDVPENAITILLSHHPEGIDNGATHGAALALTGHTHGCQFGILGHAALPFFKYNRGIVHVGSTFGYVHSGNGSWFPYRIGCPPEIAYFTLRRA